jgi:hypothetical protein
MDARASRGRRRGRTGSRGEGGAHTGEEVVDTTTAATAAHARVHDGTRPGQAKPRRPPQHPSAAPRAQGSARRKVHGISKAWWRRTPKARRTGESMASERGRTRQIDADHHVRRREAVQIRTISSPAMAGDGQIKAATAEAISASREPKGGLGLGHSEKTTRLGRLDRAQWAGPT